MSDKILIAIIVTMFFGFGTCIYANYQKLEEIKILRASNKALIEKLNIKGAELQTAKNDLNEAHEVMGELFLASMELTQEHNKLKKQCKGKR